MSTEAMNQAASNQGITPPIAPVVEDVVETPIEEKPKELESTRFSHLAKKEAELVRQQQELKKEREAIQKEQERTKPLYDKLLKFDELKKTDPVAAIRMLEFSDTDFVNFVASMEDNSTPEEKARKAAAAEIEKFKEDQLKKENEAVTQQNQRIINDFKQSIASVFVGDKEKYELSNMIGIQAQELAFDFVAECVKLGTEPPSAEEAAQMTESYYEDYFRGIMQSKKLSPKEAVEAAKEALADAPLKAEVSPRPSPSKTLSSKATATVASTVTRRETPEEKRERLIEKLRNGG